MSRKHCKGFRSINRRDARYDGGDGKAHPMVVKGIAFGEDKQFFLPGTIRLVPDCGRAIYRQWKKTKP